MEIGGLMAYAFKVFLGNPDILLSLTVWTLLTTLVVNIMRISSDAHDAEN